MPSCRQNEEAQAPPPQGLELPCVPEAQPVVLLVEHPQEQPGDGVAVLPAGAQGRLAKCCIALAPTQSLTADAIQALANKIRQRVCE